MPEDIQLQGYVNPKASITLGAASTMVIAFTTTLSLSFNLPQPVTALCLSALFAALMISAAKDIGSIAVRAGYFIIVTLMIFNTARGGNSTLSQGETLFRAAQLPAPTSLLISSAYGDPPAGTTTNAPPVTNTPPPRIFMPW
jgi:hypothetical protein